jgi:methyl-accepting chemotaxis protein
VLIENAAVAARKGHELTTSTQAAFKQNVEIAAKVGAAVDEIAAAVKEQSLGMVQINTAVGQMDKVTQSNAASAEESAAAAEELNAQAETMKHSVAELLQLVDGTAPATRSATRPATHTGNVKAVTATAPAKAAPRPANGNGHHPAVGKLEKPVLAGRRNEIPLGDDFKDF